MPDKAMAYVRMAEDTAKQITGSYERWTAFLTTAARVYKYPYTEQLMIFAQKPDATACAEYGLWTNTMRRYVRRGSKGIALIDTTGETPRIRYVFDISDTGGREDSRRLNPWSLNDDNMGTVLDSLHSQYDETEPSLPDLLETIATRLSTQYWEENKEDILDIVDGSFLEEYDEYNVGTAFRQAASVSITYMLMSRCGLEPENHFGHEDFMSIFDFNTPETVAALGTAVSQISQTVLRQIEVTIRIINYVRTKDVYQDYHKHGNSKKFESAHEQELAMHREAKKAFDTLGLKKLPSIKNLSAEYEQQLAEKRKLYAAYQKIHADMQEMLTVRANMEQILQQDAAQKEQERNLQNVR